MTVMTMNRDALTYYAMSGPFTDLSAHDARVRDLPRTLPELCRVVQGLIVHPFHAELYGLTPNALRQDEVQIRSASAMLDRILALDPSPLSNPRPPERRFVGNCRHFTVLLCAFLRAHGAAARARCGFGAYFEPAWFVDHWVGEVWDEARGSWRLVDAQLDALPARGTPDHLRSAGRAADAVPGRRRRLAALPAGQRGPGAIRHPRHAWPLVRAAEPRSRPGGSSQARAAAVGRLGVDARSRAV
jgi:hypothetical protein